MKSDGEINATAGALLGFLHDGPMTGWELNSHAQSSIGDFWTITRSQIYRELSAMAKAGLVAAEETGPRDRQPYSITEAGRSAFRDWILRMPGKEQIRYPLLLTMAFRDHVPEALLREFLETHRTEHIERLRNYESMEAAYGAGMPASARATLRFGIRYEAAVLQWFDDLPELMG